MRYDDLESLRQRHPAWRLLRADSAAFVAATLHRVFVAGNVRTIAEDALIEAVADSLFAIRATDPEAFPKPAKQYITDWADPQRDWLRKFYPTGSDTPSYDLTPSAEKALTWLDSLTARAFVGTESRLLTLFDLLRQIAEGAEEDPAQRLANLRRRRDEIDAEIERVERGEVRVLDETAIRDRFQQFTSTARDLLSDFREVEENFRRLDRGVREQIATWDGSRGALLDEVFGERDAITDTDQGMSFQAFWDFLMSADRQEQFDRMLQQVLAMQALQRPDPALRHVVHDWLTAADAVQATVAALSQQLRRFLDDRAYLENRRIAGLVRSIESSALRIRDDQPTGTFADMDEVRSHVVMPMARRLYQPRERLELISGPVASGEEDFPAEALYTQFHVDKQRLQRAIADTLADRGQVTLAEVVSEHPVTQGLAEVVSYLSVADENPRATIADGQQEIDWSTDDGRKSAQIPLVVFLRQEVAESDG